MIILMQGSNIAKTEKTLDEILGPEWVCEKCGDSYYGRRVAKLCLVCAEAELTRLRAQVAELHTLVECAAPDCKRDVAVGGMCVEHAEGELERLRGIERVARKWAPSQLREWACRASKWWKYQYLLALADALEAK